MQKSLTLYHDGDVRFVYREGRPHFLAKQKKLILQ